MKEAIEIQGRIPSEGFISRIMTQTIKQSARHLALWTVF